MVPTPLLSTNRSTEANSHGLAQKTMFEVVRGNSEEILSSGKVKLGVREVAPSGKVAALQTQGPGFAARSWHSMVTSTYNPV